MSNQVLASVLVFGPGVTLMIGYAIGLQCSNRTARREARYIPFEEPVIIRPVVRRAA